ncbi:CamS family sex pheromone protein [Bacillus atrophaeus]|uniref:CamS family sex pheromone protein n=1 Tax=Bacillus atrophaeus TaxID=1452 RepID=UPI000D07E66E|nr:CamS family sex pheromone protein [Bacillus atrophaeus]MCY8826245.1 CamS family sex pheromone protein [Bacillus atrophaeus]MCY8841626.1 CamS family sex pheromone protein [Bacillus atrophaeus]MEC0806359.1 CamS family sex pheromone protein [Bacillus atrophaeus]MEC0855180.1 CamS family sex pheromone protein [Bacillus atrophaeus]MEC0858506.1 CamS family sex pheromone protein [Bacillus atrophaeus]
MLSSCSPSFGGDKEEEITQKTEKSSEKAIIPKYNISDSYYKMVLPFKAGKARGLTTERLNTRLDIDEFETGLMRLAQDSFSTDDYLFQEGQYLDEDTVLSWLARKKEGSDLKKAEKKDKDFENLGLNPVLPSSGSTKEKNENSPVYLATMLEHDYLVRKDKNSIQLGGVMIGLALNSVYYYREKTGDPQQEVTIDDKTLRKEGEKIAQEVINRLRKKDNLKNIPITVALYKQASKTSIVPGNFIAKTEVKAGSTDIGSWDDVKEKYVFFPADDSTKQKYPDDAELFTRFKNAIDSYFPNYTGVVGTAMYENDDMKKMKIEIPMQFYGKSEVVAFTQYLTGEVMDYYSKNSLDVEIDITSSDGQEAVILRNAGDSEPTVHIYD